MKLSLFSHLLAGTYTDKFEVRRFQSVTNADGTKGVKLSDTPIIENEPCRISFTSSDNPNAAKEDVNPKQLQLKLFCRPLVDVRKGDKIITYRMADDGVTVLHRYTGTANLPNQYVTHKEVLLTQVGEA